MSRPQAQQARKQVFDFHSPDQSEADRASSDLSDNVSSTTTNTPTNIEVELLTDSGSSNDEDESTKEIPPTQEPHAKKLKLKPSGTNLVLKEYRQRQFNRNANLLSRVRNSLRTMLLEVNPDYGDWITPATFADFVITNTSSLQGLCLNSR
jgi:hypothetical protein